MKTTTNQPQTLQGFTPGEWFASEVDETGGNIVSKDGWHIAKINPFAPENSNSKANAALIASAPTLLKENSQLKEQVKLLREALHECLDIIDRIGEEYSLVAKKHSSFTKGEYNKIRQILDQTK